MAWTTMEQAAQQWSTWHKLLRKGGTPPSTGAPVLPTLGAAPAAVALGVETRFRDLVQAIKVHANYNTGIGEALGIEGEEQTGPDLSSIQPRLTVRAIGGAVNVGWGCQGHTNALDFIRLEVDRTGSGFGLLATDTTPGYTDTTPLPATAAKWTYRAIFYVDDHAVGQWSDPVSVMVGT